MRDLMECQAEVFRRSEERIKAKKQRRKQLLMACVPLAVCVTLLSAFLLPAMMPAGEDGADNGSAMGQPTQSSKEGASPVEISIRGSAEEVWVITDPERVLAINAELQELYNGQLVGGMFYGKPENKMEEPQAGSQSEEYRIMIVDGNGVTVTYTLQGSELCREDTQNRISLSQHQLTELKKALEINE